MKSNAFFLLATLPLLCSTQVLSPISTTNYNLDAIAENTTAAAHTTGAIDGSDYVMYSVAYGTVYSTGTGLPNSGLISSLTRTYQLQPYNQNNMLYLTAGQTDSIILSTPASYAALGLLGFATEGAGTMNLTIRFSDNSTQVISNQGMPDWFGTGSAILTGFDRCNRSAGTPNYSTTQPKMFSLDLPVICANRSKQVTALIVHNSGSNARVCIMALSGAAVPSYSASVQPVTCSGGHNGSATITPTGGFPTFTYTISSAPQQYTNSPVNLPVGIYSYTAQDVALCPATGSFTVQQQLVPQPSLQVQSSTSVICAGQSVTLTAGGASTYTWLAGGNTSATVVNPGISTTYTVTGHTTQNCLRSGQVSISVNQLPAVAFTAPAPTVCSTQQAFALSGNPVGGLYSGSGVQGNNFNPSLAGTGTHVVTYLYTDANNCSNTASTSVAVHSLAVPAISSGSPVCLNGAAFQVTVDIPGGTFSGSGISATGLITTTLAGQFPFTYSISSGPCESSAASAFTVLPLPVLTFSLSKTDFCLTNPDVALNAQPGPGVFSGPGVNGFFFKASQAGAGTHNISYSYTNTSGCSNVKTIQVKVNDCTGITEQPKSTITIYPNPANTYFIITNSKSETLYMVNSLGQVISHFTTNAAEATEVQLAPQHKGLFFIVNSGGAAISKIIIQ